MWRKHETSSKYANVCTVINKNDTFPNFRPNAFCKLHSIRMKFTLASENHWVSRCREPIRFSLKIDLNSPTIFLPKRPNHSCFWFWRIYEFTACSLILQRKTNIKMIFQNWEAKLRDLQKIQSFFTGCKFVIALSCIHVMKRLVVMWNWAAHDLFVSLNWDTSFHVLTSLLSRI